MFEDPLQLFCQDLYLLSHVASEAEVSGGENMLGYCFLHCRCMCSGVPYENRTSAGLRGPGHWNGIVLLSDAFIMPTNHTLKQENCKCKTKSWKIYLCQNLRNLLSLLLCHSLTSLILPASGRQRNRFILLRQRTSLTRMWTLFQTHTHTHTHTQEHWGLLSYTSH